MQLKYKIFGLFLLIAMLPIAILGALSYQSARASLIDRIVNGLESVADLQEKRIEETLSSTLAQVAMVTSRTQLRLSLDNYNKTGDPSNLTFIEGALKDAKSTLDSIDSISVINLEGVIISSTKDELLGLDISEEDYFPASQESIQLWELYKDENNILKARLIGPLTLEGEIIGSVELRSSASDFIQITEDYTGVGETGESVLGKRNEAGDAVFFTPLRFDSGAALNRAIPSTSTRTPIIPATAGLELSLTDPETVDYRGEPVFAVTRYIDALEWGLVVKIDRSEALSPIRELTKTYIVIILVTIFVITLTAFALARTITEPIRLLSAFAQDLKKGHFSSQTEVKGENEFGVLADSMNSMARKLNELYRHLEKKVQKRTAQLSLSKKNLELHSKELEKYKLALDTTNEHVVITDADGIILYTNKACLKVTGYSPKEAIGAKAGSLWGGHMSKPFYESMWKRIKKEKKAFVGNLQQIKKNGEVIEMQMSIAPVLNRRGNVEFFVSVYRDITREKRIDEMKTDFISLASHQLRTPLSAINWITEILIAGDEGKLKPGQLSLIQDVATSNQRMIHLVNSLLNISRIESGRIIINPSPTDLNSLINEVVKEMKPELLKRKQKCIVSVNEEIGEISLDHKLIREVFKNLISNAIKYTPNGGQISIFVSSKNTELVCQVSDTGYGIPIEDQNDIFNKFFRASNAHVIETEGTGLGLYLVKQIIEASRGKIWFKSKEDEGTSFFFTLPRKGMRKKDGVVTLND